MIKNVFVLFIGLFFLSSSYAQYCKPPRNGVPRERVKRINLGMLYNKEVFATDLYDVMGGRAAFFNDFTAKTVTFIRGKENFIYIYERVFSNRDVNNYAAKIFIDWNQDGRFDGENETIAEIVSEYPPYVRSIVVPKDQAIGDYRIRIRYTNEAVDIVDACSGGDVQTFDYTIKIDDFEFPEIPVGSAGECSNADFESQNFDNWNASIGYNPYSVALPGGVRREDVYCCGTDSLAFNVIDDVLKEYWLDNGDLFKPRHTIVTQGLDPTTGVINRVPPWGGGAAVRLGNTESVLDAERITQTFTVSTDRPYFMFGYALVMNEPGHPLEEQPYFEAKIYDANGILIPCSRYQLTSRDDLPGFERQGKVVYRDWDRVFVNLNDYAGQDVTVEFTTADCAQSGHYGYAYIDALCDPEPISPVNKVVCFGESITLEAPVDEGGLYEIEWSTGDTTYTIEISPTQDTTIISIELIPLLGGCPVTIYDTIFMSKPFEISPETVYCNENDTYTVEFLMIGGNPELYDISGTSEGTLVKEGENYKFTSAPITPDSTNYTFIFSDGTSCGTRIITGSQSCPPNCKVFPIVDAGSDAKICSGDPYTFSDVIAIESVSKIDLTDTTGVLWYTNEGTGSLSDSSIMNPVYTASPNDLGKKITFYLVGYAGHPDTVNCPNALDSVTLTVGLPPEVEAGLADTTCLGDVFTVSGADTSKVSGFRWFHDGLGGLENETTLVPVYTPVKADEEQGFVNIVLMGIGAAPCQNVFDTVTIVISGSAQAEAGIGETICETGSYEVSGSMAIGKSFYWTHDGAGNFDDSLSLTPIYSAFSKDAGNDVELIIHVAAGRNCLNDSDTVIISIVAQPTIDAGLDTIICGDGSYTVVGSSIENALNFLWTHNGTGTIENNTSSTPTYYPGVGDYGDDVVLTAIAQAAFPCENKKDSLIVSINEPAQAEAGENQVTCVGNEARIFNSRAIGSSVEWTHTGGGELIVTDSLQPIYRPVAADVGTPVEITLTVTPGAPCTPVSDIVYVTVIMPVEIEAGDAGEICQLGTHTVVNASVTAGIRYEWFHKGAGELIDTNTLSPTYTPGITDAEKDIYLYLTAYPDSLCPELRDSILIHVAGIARVFAGDDGIICLGNDYIIPSIFASGYSSIEWEHNGDGSINSIDSLNPVYTPEALDLGNTIQIIATARGVAPCTDASDTVFLTVNLPPTVDAGIDGLICSTDSYELADAVSDRSFVYKWTHTGSGSFDNDVSLNPTYIATPADAGKTITLYVAALGEPSCFPAINSMQLTISGQVIAYAGDPSSACVNIEHQIQRAFVEKTDNYTWFHSGAGILIDETTLTPSYIPAVSEAETTIELFLIAHSEAPCLDDTSTVVLPIIDEPTVNAGDDAVICLGESFEISTASAERYTVLNWIHNGSGILQNNGGLSPIYISGIDDAGNTVTLTVQADPLSPCAIPATDQMEIEVENPPSIDVEKRATICIGGDYTIQASGDNYSSLLWEIVEGEGKLENSTTLSPRYISVPEDKGSTVLLKVIAQAVGNCPVKEDEVKIRVIDEPEVDAGEPENICINELHTLNGTAINTAEFTWSHTGNGVLENETSLTPTYRSTWEDRNSVVVFSLTGEAAIPCSREVTDQTYVKILPTPGAYAGENRIICEGESTTIGEVNAEDYFEVTWEVVQGRADNLKIPTEFIPTYESDDDEGNTVVVLVMTASSLQPCIEPVRDTVEIIIKELPRFSTTDGTICPGESFTIVVEPINKEGEGVYDWYADEFANEYLGTEFEYTVDRPEQTTQIWVRPSRGCKVIPIPVEIIVHSKPFADFSIDTTEISEPTQTITFTDLSENTSTGTWDFGDGTVEKFTPNQNIEHTYNIETGKVPDAFEIHLEVETEFGCKDEATVLLPVNLKWAIYIPNAFSPNGDQINETFRIAGFGISEYRLNIFNRWGDNIYTSSDLSQQWDGRDHIMENDVVVQTDETKKVDTYVYKVEIVNIFGKREVYRGEVNLIR